jgi:hypothetical protein
MTSYRRPSIDAQALQNVVDGTLCRAESPRPGILQFTSLVPASTPFALVYCQAWSGAERQAFWRGFSGRLEQFAEEALGFVTWIEGAFGLGEQQGDFQKAWRSFGEGLGTLAELAGKVAIVAGVTPIALLHPKREAYRQELAALGLALTQAMIQSYRDAYRVGGVPQCTGVLLADAMRLAFEILATKGAGKMASSTRLSRYLPASAREALAGSRLADSELLLSVAKRLPLDARGRPIALFFGIKDPSRIPAEFATLNRMLEATPRGRTMLKQLEHMPWEQQKNVWWELSERVSDMAGNSGGRVHVYTNAAYYDRVFPKADKLRAWWQGHKEELILRERKALALQGKTGEELAAGVEKERRRFEAWTQDEIEAQYYAIQGKNRFSGHYEDEIFLKIEQLNVSGVQFHAIDDTGRELHTWKRNW